MADDDAPSGDALDRATKFVLEHDLRPGLVRELVEDIAKLIDRADAAADFRTEAGDAHEEKIRRRAAQSIVDGCTNNGRGVDGRSYWALTERIAKFLADGGGDADTLRRRVADLEQAQEVRARAIRGAQLQHRRLEEELADARSALTRTVEDALRVATEDQLLEEVQRRMVGEN